WLLALAAAVWTHVRRAGDPAREAPRALATLGAALALWRALDVLVDAHALADGGLVARLTKALLGLAAWWAVMALIAVGRKRRDLIVRGLTVALALTLGAIGVWGGGAAALTIPGLAAFRWKRAFPTRVLLRLAFADVMLLVLLGWRITGPAAAGGAGGGLVSFATWAYASVFGFLTLLFLSLLASMVRDPSLGIRTVSRRLALSHVMVVVVPLALTVLLWMATTVLGVSTDRARVAAVELESEIHALHAGLSAALDPAPPDGGLARWAADHAAQWPRASVWVARDTTWRRLAGADVLGHERLRAWSDSLVSLPEGGFVARGDSVYLGAIVRAGPAGARTIAVALVPVSTLLPGAPERIAGVQLAVRPRLSASDFRSDSSIVVTGSRAHVSINTGQDTFAVNDTTALEALGSGHALAPGLVWRGGRWTRSPYLVTASLAAHVALAGLVRGVRESPLGILPVLLLGMLAALFALVAGFDVIMVTGMGRSIAAAIGALRQGAARLEAGDLSYRIRVGGEDDLWEVAAAFNTAAQGLERARALEQERTRIENELALARQIQARLLPRARPRVPGLDIAGLSESARQVGGDYYDHIAAGDGRVLLVIADVSGKGVPAALLMSGVRASVMSQDLPRTDAPTLARRLNEFVSGSVEPGRFVTAFVAWVDGARDEIEYVNAGHNPPLLVRADGTHETLEQGGLILGILPDAPFERGLARWHPGDRLVLYTDGVTEAANVADEMWGEERLLAAVRAGGAEPCDALVRAIAGQVRAFEGERGAADDVTLLAARRLPPGA
ncbi:MAG TPA: SpoIIE family protein phosphatase, partial [Candidatus Eisenbacteria bacterium]|nr:SpoIIE family protein phosphatase [Candidatus Eisenbacteria bacterium]